MGQVSANGHGTGHVQLFSFNILIHFSYIVRRQAVQPLQRLGFVPYPCLRAVPGVFMTMRRFLLLGSVRERLCSAIVVGLLASGLAGPAFAGQADVCYSDRMPMGSPDVLTASTSLACPLAGRHTLPQLAEAAWTIGPVQPVTMDYAVDAATQTPQSHTAWMVIIQKGTK